MIIIEKELYPIRIVAKEDLMFMLSDLATN